MVDQDWQKNLDEATLLAELARVCWAEADYDKANSYLVQSLRILESQFGTEHIPLVRVLHSLGLLARIRIRYDEAETYYLRALGISQKMLGAESPATATRLNYLAGLYNAQGDFARAEQLLLQSLSVYTKTTRAKRALALVLMALTLVCKRQEKNAEAEIYREQMKQVHQQLEGGKDDLKTALSKLADFFYSQNRLDDADLVFRYGLILGEEQEFPHHPFVAESLQGLARLYADYDAFDESVLLYQRAIICFEKLYGSQSSRLGSLMKECAAVLKRQNKPEEVEKLEKRISLLIADA